MAFDGRDYHQAFEETCSNFRQFGGGLDARDSLEQNEWMLWEAIRGVFFYAAILISTLILVLIELIFNLKDKMSVFENMVYLAIVIIPTALVIYWLLRFIFWCEISRHVRGRNFGDGGLD